MSEEILKKPLEDEIVESYMLYSMSVIIGRAIPDVRDGLKPVQRRILYGMMELGLRHNSSFKKSARIVGEVMGKYHPHGDAAIYDALVKMGQDFSMRYKLVDGQGNFGSIDRDPPAAMRYTEARLSRIAEEMLADIDKNTVDFIPNFDESLKEPIVLPSKIPNLLLNGSSGIAVGMATNIPPHNINEIIDGLVFLIDNPNSSIEDLIKLIKGPDFPTGGIIIGKSGIISMYKTGRGSFKIRGKAQIEKKGKNFSIVISEIPFQVSKAGLIGQIANFAKNSKKNVIRNVRDESDKRGIRVVVELTRDAQPEIVLNQLYKHTSLETSFAAQMLVIDELRRPRVMNLKELMEAFLKHRLNVILRRSEYELENASKRAHIIEGLIRASRSIETVVDLIRNSKDSSEAINELKEVIGVTEEQAKAILDMRLSRLTSLESEKLLQEHSELTKTISQLKELISDERKIYKKIKEELLELKSKYGDDRRTSIEFTEPKSFSIEDLISDDEIIIMITHEGYISASTLQNYRMQYRGGKGVMGMRTREGDFVEHIISTTKMNKTMVVASSGRAYVLNNYEIEETSRGARGKHILSYLRAKQDEKVKVVIDIGKEFDEKRHLFLITKKGKIKRVPIVEFENARTSGVIAIGIRENDEVVDASIIDITENQTVVVSTKNGMCIRFPIDDVRPMGRGAMGVNAINLKDGDEVVSMTIVKEDGILTLLTVCSKGYGKRTSLSDYRVQSRGGTGIKNVSNINKTGQVVAVLPVKDDDEILVVTENGFTIRFQASSVRTMGRVTSGVKIINLGEGDKISSATIVRE
ncbi:MAG TPA: DNA gyrase subunit A [Thermotogaceae bacterium]|nr:DNA gyrase subunit A [Thermotogota bacterium]HEW91724.1 DNA gyrase subunit A [Thermotogaceae bacterium]